MASLNNPLNSDFINRFINNGVVLILSMMHYNTDSIIGDSLGDNAHDVIIHGLNRSIDYPGKKVFFPVAPFQESVESWNGIPAVYIASGTHIHPDEIAELGMEAAITKYGGKDVGIFSNTQVITAGQERLQSRVTITDPVIEQAIQNHKIGISSTFYAKGKHAAESPIIPSYVLLFDTAIETPRDAYSTFLNTTKSPEDKQMADDAVTIAELKRDLDDSEKLVVLANTKAKDNDEKITSLDENIALMNTAAGEKDSEIASLKEQLVVFENTAANQKWEHLKATRIPKGLVAKPEDEKALRTLMNSDKDAFYGKLMDVVRPAETDAEGNVFNNTNAEDDDDSGAIQELKKLTGRFY